MREEGDVVRRSAFGMEAERSFRGETRKVSTAGAIGVQPAAPVHVPRGIEHGPHPHDVPSMSGPAPGTDAGSIDSGVSGPWASPTGTPPDVGPAAAIRASGRAASGESAAPVSARLRAAKTARLPCRCEERIRAGLRVR